MVARRVMIEWIGRQRVRSVGDAHSQPQGASVKDKAPETIQNRHDLDHD